MSHPIVRLPNWVGDVVMSLPALARLNSAGLRPTLVAKHWAGPLLAGLGWDVATLPDGTGNRVRLLRRLRTGAGKHISHATPAIAGAHGRARRRQDPDALLLTNSLSSALEARLAGLRPLGYRHDGRDWLLASAIRANPASHECARFDHLAAAFTGALARQQPSTLTRDPPIPRLPLSPRAVGVAGDLLRQALGHNSPRFACIAPFSAGTLAGQSKAWPLFATYAPILARRLPVAIVPGPTEVAKAQRDFPDCVVLENLDLGLYAAVLARATVVVANDTGPGHMAAAVGAPLVSVLGPTAANRYAALGATVTLVQGHPWPSIDAVDAAVSSAIGG